jgi:hypothetical protein
MSKEFETLLSDFARCLGLEDYEPTNPAAFEIEDLTVTLEEQGDIYGGLVILYAQIGNVPMEQETIAMKAMLEANYLWSGTGDATLGMNSDTREVVIACQFPILEMNGEGLMSVVEQFVIIADIWRSYIRDLPETTSGGTENKGPDTPSQSIIWG